MKRIIKLILTSLTIVFLLSLMLALTLYWLITYRTQGEYFNSGGISIHYTVEGKSDPVILIHGFAVNSDINWRRTGVINTLKNNFKVVSLDLRGHGLSGKPHVPNEYGLKMVSDIINLMDHLKISKAHIAGYSLGGFVALKLATLYPERVKSLSVLGAGWEEPKENSFFKRALKNSVEKLE
ncbi:MAG: alpha/beta hydrolase, partial [Candidatus Hydrogenedentes bacterium]|nr:alpha/beta hydrolase [Candidatus Hydrogenedentota bacterium]